MGFRQGAYAKIWTVENKGNYSVCNLSISKKNRDTDEYEVEFQDGFVRFVGNAHNDISNIEIPANGLSIKIENCDVTTKYDADRKKLYINYVVFGFEIPENNIKGSTNKSGVESKRNTKIKQHEPKTNEYEEDDYDLPF